MEQLTHSTYCPRMYVRVVDWCARVSQGNVVCILTTYAGSDTSVLDQPLDLIVSETRLFDLFLFCSLKYSVFLDKISMISLCLPGHDVTAYYIFIIFTPRPAFQI